MNLEKLPFEAPYLTTPQMLEVNRAMIEDFKIELIQMMENAGRNLAHLTRTRFLDLCCAGSASVGACTMPLAGGKRRNADVSRIVRTSRLFPRAAACHGRGFDRDHRLHAD